MVGKFATSFRRLFGGDAEPDELPGFPTEMPEAVWCVVGNVIDERPYGPEGQETRHGTKIFSAGTKIHLASVFHRWALDDPVRHGDESVIVVGKGRGGRRYVRAHVQVKHTTGWRVQLVMKPPVLRKLWDAGWEGFRLREGEFEPPEDRGSPVAVRALLCRL